MVERLFRREKSLAELEEETERLEMEDKKASVEMSITEKKAAIAQLRQRGLAPKHFGFNWEAIKQWLKTH